MKHTHRRRVVAALASIAAVGTIGSAPAGATTVPQTPAPERIVSLSASLTEWLYAMGAGEQMVAVDKNSDFPEDAPTTDLSGFEPNIEAISEFEPDLVVLASDRDGIVAALDAAGIPSLLLKAPADLDELHEHVVALGDVVGHEEEAASALEEFDAATAEIVDGAPDRDDPLRYYYEVSDSSHSVTSDTFVGAALGLLGLESIADDVDPEAGGYPQLTAEYVLDTDPDAIFVAWTSGESPSAEDIAARPGWDELSAVQDGHVIVLDTDIATRWGPRVAELLAAVATASADW